MSAIDDLRVRLTGRYEIERELGRGGMGAVYLARDVRLGRPVALKVLPTEFALIPALRERFLRETHTAASFSHPNIVPVYAIEESDDLLAYVMGYVEGESLAERVKRAGPLTVRETVRLLQDVGYALAYAHGRGVVHRDIKPDNIMIERATGRASVMDFGVARAITTQDPTAAEGLTRVGEVVGTPEYMSPEQATGDRVDGRSDLYSLGLTAYFAVTGRIAMAADSTGKALAKQITETLPPMRSVRGDLPAALSDAIDRCVLKEPDARFENAEALVEALDAAQLATPEIPLSIRMFAQELVMLSFVLIAGALGMYYLIRLQMDTDTDTLDVLLPIVLLASVLLTRMLQTLGEGRRLVLDGFSTQTVQRGLVAIYDERQARRVDLRVNPVTLRERRRRFAYGGGGFLFATAMFIGALLRREKLGPHSYRTGNLGAAMIMLAAISFGVSIAFLLRSPFRMPLGERVFRLVWLGPLGRSFVWMATRGVPRAGSPSGASSLAAARAATPRPVTPRPLTVAGDRVDQLETRVSELERWRRSSGGV